MWTQSLHAVALRLRRYGVVEIARGGWVDGERGEVGEVTTRERRLARRRGSLPGLGLECRRKAAIHAAIPKQRGDHVASALGRAECPQGAGATRAEVHQGDVAGVNPDRASAEGDPRPTLEQRLRDREAAAPLEGRHPPAERPGAATAHGSGLARPTSMPPA